MIAESLFGLMAVAMSAASLYTNRGGPRKETFFGVAGACLVSVFCYTVYIVFVSGFLS